MSSFMFDTDTASRLIRRDRATIGYLRRSGATDISLSAVSQSELLFGARISRKRPIDTAAVQGFLARVTVLPWDDAAAHHHAEIRAANMSRGRSAGLYDVMIAAHARAMGAVLVTSDKAIANLAIPGLVLNDWS